MVIVSVMALAINTNGYVQAYRLRSSLYALSLLRMIGRSACYLGPIVGSILLILGVEAGTYVGAVALVASFVYLISGAWLLILGTLQTAD